MQGQGLIVFFDPDLQGRRYRLWEGARFFSEDLACRWIHRDDSVTCIAEAQGGVIERLLGIEAGIVHPGFVNQAPPKAPCPGMILCALRRRRRNGAFLSCLIGDRTGGKEKSEKDRSETSLVGIADRHPHLM